MKLTSRTYNAFFFRQRQTAPAQCAFVASSADIFDWASVPTKTEKTLRNFQRPEIETHIEEIKTFFDEYPENCSPSSIVVGFRNPAAVSCAGPDGKPLNLASVKPGDVTIGKVSIEFLDPTDLDDAAKREVVRELRLVEIEATRTRLLGLQDGALAAPQEGDLKHPDVEEVDPADQGEGAESQGEGEVENDAVVDDDIDIDEIAREQGEWVSTLESLDPDELDGDELEQWVSALHELHKAGLIIDGQHRVKGTKDDNILFSVTALPDAPWPELAFQFIVLNKAARKVPDSLLINIVGNSLTEAELTNIEGRLNASGVPVPLYQGVMKLHDDPESPFYGRLKFGVKGERGIIDASAAKTKIINFWFRCKIYGLVKHLLPGRTKDERIRDWTSSGKWYEFLKAFWNAARAFYEENSSLWSSELDADGKTPASKLMRVTIINLTQETILEHMQKALEDQVKNDPTGKTRLEDLLPDLAAFKNYFEMYFKRLKPEFFQDWGPSAKGFDGSPATRDSYKDAVRSVVSGDATIMGLKKGKPLPHLLYR